MELLKLFKKKEKFEKINKNSKKKRKKKKVGLYYEIKDFFKKIRQYKKSKEYSSLKQEIFNIVIYGISFLSVYYVLTKSVDYWLILFGGISLWIFERKILEFIKEIIASFRIVEVNR